MLRVLGVVLSRLSEFQEKAEKIKGKVKSAMTYPLVVLVMAVGILMFPPMVISMVEVGEETGALPDMLMKVADSYDEDVDNAVASMTSIIEPLLIIFLAVVVGSIVIALFMPLVSIMGSLSACPPPPLLPLRPPLPGWPFFWERGRPARFSQNNPTSFPPPTVRCASPSAPSYFSSNGKNDGMIYKNFITMKFHS